MAANANALVSNTGTYNVNGNSLREDLSDIVTQIGREEVPFTTWAATGTASNPISHDWETVNLATPTNTAAAEGDTYTTDAPKVATRLTNTSQIIDGVVEVSDSTEWSDTAGAMGKMDRQVLIRALEKKRDAEAAYLSNTVKTGANATRRMGGLHTYAGVNDVGSGGTAPTGDGTTAYVPGTLRDLSFTLLNGQLQSAWTFGCKTEVMMLGSNQKLNFDAIVPDQQQLSIANTNVDSQGAQLVSTVSVWRSAFGDVKMVMNHVMNSLYNGVIFGMDGRTAYRPKVCPLAGKGWSTFWLAKVTRSERKVISWEGTIEVPNPKAIWLLGALNP